MNNPEHTLTNSIWNKFPVLNESQIISIEGNIGSGKSTLLEKLKNHFKDAANIVFLQEPVDEWDKIRDKNGITILSKFYENQEKYSFAFQMMAYISRLAILKKAIEDHPNSIIITERCLNTDRYVFAKLLYDTGKIEEIEYQIYLRWFDELSNLGSKQKIIYMKTDPSICFYRIGKRNRNGESGIALDYLEKCSEYHDNMIENVDSDKLLTIDSNIDTDENHDINNIWINQIIQFITEHKKFYSIKVL
jgi:deoxyadenosine/deoxycytidine kinase